MSVVAVKKYKNKIEMASDSQLTWGGRKILEKEIRHSKLFKINKMIIGSAGSCFEGSLLEAFAKNHKPARNDKDAVRDFVMEFGDYCKKVSSNWVLENNSLIVLENNVYLSMGYEIQGVNDYFAVGSGMFVALGVLYQGGTVCSAVEAAKQYDLHCSGDTVKITKVIN